MSYTLKLHIHQLLLYQYFQYKRESLVSLSKGDRNLTKFCADVGLDSGNISRFLNGKTSSPPKPATLKLIAQASENRVTFRELLYYGGYIESLSEDYVLDAPLREINEDSNIHEVLNLMKMDFIKIIKIVKNDFSWDKFESVMDFLYFAISEAKNLKKTK